MIVDLPDTTSSRISKTLVKIREEGGAVALGRVLTLVISTELGHEEEAIEAANDASRLGSWSAFSCWRVHCAIRRRSTSFMLLKSSGTPGSRSRITNRR